MKKLFAIIAILTAMYSCGEAPKSDQIQLPYEKYTLDNGLDVVLSVDKSDPIVAVAIQYHVGSSREQVGKTGFAHFFEHMLFQRSEHLPRNAFFTKIDEMGGEFNGSTGNDGTNYYEMVPRDALEKVLWMESDRMGFFINTVTQDGLEREIDVVSNEKRQGENGAFGKGYGILVRNYYPEGHPYSWPVIGMISDLKSATVDDVKAFYDQYYSPSNATLTIVGDFDVEEAKQLVEKYFGEIKAHGNAPEVKPEPVALDGNKSLYYTDEYATNAEVDIMYPAVEQYNEDSYALRIMSMLLSNGKKSPFYQVLVNEDKVASSVNVAYQAMERSGSVNISVSAYKDVDLDDVAASFKKAFAKFETEGVDADELVRVKVMQETMMYNTMTTVLGKALQIARNNEFAGRPDQMIEDLKHYQNVTAEDVMRVYNKYIKGHNSFTLCGVPVATPELAIEGSERVFPVEDNKFEQSLSSKGGAIVDVVDYEFTPSAFDRSVEPALMSNTPVLSIPEVWNTELSNGVKVNGMAYTELPVVNFSIIFNQGKMNDKDGKVGTAMMTAAVMNSGTANRTPEELSSEIGRLGARLTFGAGSEYMWLSGYCLSKNLDKVVALVGEMILEPRWDEQELEVVRKRFLTGLNQEKTNPSSIASRVFGEVLYGKDSRLAMRNSGTEETINTLTMDDLKEFYKNNMFNNNIQINYVGGLSAGEVKTAFEPLAQTWKTVNEPESVEVETDADADAPAPTAKIYFADFPGASQSYVLLGKKMMPMNDADYYPAEIVNYDLGGTSAGLLFKILRLQNGYTYGAYSRVNSGNYSNIFRAYSSVQAAYTVQSMKIMKEMISGYPEHYTQDVLDKTRVSLVNSNLSAFEDPSELNNILDDIVIYNLDSDYIRKEGEQLRNFTLTDAQSAIGKWMNYDDMFFVIVGDAKTQLPAIKAAGLGEVVVVE